MNNAIPMQCPSCGCLGGEHFYQCEEVAKLLRTPAVELDAVHSHNLRTTTLGPMCIACGAARDMLDHPCAAALRRDMPPTPPLEPRWRVTSSGWVVDRLQETSRVCVAQILGYGHTTDPSKRIAAARVAALIVNAPEAVEVIRAMMTVNLRDPAAMRIVMDRARQWLALALESEEEIP